MFLLIIGKNEILFLIIILLSVLIYPLQEQVLIEGKVWLLHKYLPKSVDVFVA